MLPKLLAPLAKHWRGPAVLVKYGKDSFQLGVGTATTSIVIHNSHFLRQLFRDPTMAFGEAYMRGNITIEGDIYEVLEAAYKNDVALHKLSSPGVLKSLRRLLPERVGKKEAIQNARHHYDVGNDFYKLWLDPSLTYTCAYYATPHDSLDIAQQQKLELVCRKIRLAPGQRVLDIGCGWGGFLFYAATHYGVQATGVVAAKEQAAYIEEEAKKRGLSDKVKVITADWRDAAGEYDRVVSIGLLEHVGQYQHDEFFGLYRKLLAPGGLAFIHTIGRMKRVTTDTWIRQYVFPGADPATLDQIAYHAGRHGLQINDVENLWQHYVRTLDAWSANFAKVQEQVVTMYDEEFARMWWLYLQGSKAAFAFGQLHLWQVVLMSDKAGEWPLNREVEAHSFQKG